MWRKFALFGLWLTSACTLEPYSNCEHGAAADGTCCPAWGLASNGRCSLRRWAAPDDATGLGVAAFFPSVDIDRFGKAWLAFEEQAAGGSGVVVAREMPSGWSHSSPSLGLPGFNTAPRLAVVDEAHAVVVWEHVGLEAAAASEVRVGIGDGHFAEPPSGGRFSYPPYAYQNKVLAHSDGELVVTWNQAMDAGLRRGICIATRREGEADFVRPSSAQDVVSRSFIFSNSPELARNERGDTVVTWYESVGAKLRVMASERSGQAGYFTHARDEDALSPPEGDVENPEPAVAEDGRAAIVWRQVFPDGKMAVFLAERTADGVWTRPTIDEGFGVPVDLAWNTRVAFARSGDLYVTWEEHVGDDWAVMLAHRDAGGRWLASGREAMRLSQERAISPVLRVAADGTVVVLWRSFSGSRWRVMARRSAVDADGLREVDRWSNAVSLSRDGGDAGQVTLAAARQPSDHGGHRFVAAWSQDGRAFTASLD